MISVVIICYNEERNIANALDSVAWCDNVVVVDSFSTDRTEEICRRYTNVTFVRNQFEGFAQQRQFSLSCDAVRHPWVLALDADERVPPELARELVEIAQAYRPGKPVAYDIAMRIVMWGKWLRYSSGYPVYWRRFIHRDHCRYVQEGHAEKVVAHGPVARTRGDLIHEDAKGLAAWLSKHNRYSTQEAAYALDGLRRASFLDLFSDDRLKRRRVMKRIFRALPFNSMIRFLYLFVLRGGFLDGVRGYEFCRLRAHHHFLVKLKMKEMQRSTAAASGSPGRTTLSASDESTGGRR